MNSDDKDDKKALDEDSFFQDDYDEEPIDYDLNTDKFLEDDIFEPDLTKNWDNADTDEELPFDDELEFEEDDFDPAPDLELEDEEDYDHVSELELELDPDEESLQDSGSDRNDQWHGDDMESQDEEYSQPWPLGLFAAGIIALVLLARSSPLPPATPKSPKVDRRYETCSFTMKSYKLR